MARCVEAAYEVRIEEVLSYDSRWAIDYYDVVPFASRSLHESGRIRWGFGLGGGEF